jgi:hypothetical protein
MHDVCDCSPFSRARSRVTGLSIALLAAAFASGCSKPVSFSESVFPVLQERCGDCHEPGGKGYEKTGFSVADYDAVMKGTKFGPVIVAGSSASSSLMRMVEHKTDPEIHMPHGKAGLTRDQLDLVRAWIDQGAKNN